MESKSTRHVRIDAFRRSPVLVDRAPGAGGDKTKQVPVKETKTHPRGSTGNEDGSIYFIGTASTVIEWQGARILADPNFLQAGVPGPPKAPLVMVTMDARQGVELSRLMGPDATVPIHYDDFSVFLSLGEFKKETGETGLQDGVVYLDRGDQYRFLVRDGGESG